MGLSSECDPPNNEAEVGKILDAHLKNAQTLPFVGVLTQDLKWVHGFSGHRRPEQFLEDLAVIEKSPLLDASPAVAKKLEKIAGNAEKYGGKSDWKKVLECEDEARELTGRHPARDRVSAQAAKARAFAETTLTGVLDSLLEGGDRTEARKALKNVAKVFSGRPEAEDADAGVKAADRLARLEKLEGDALAAARAKFAEEFESTRWTKLFGGKWPKGEKTQEKPEEKPGEGGDDKD